MAKAYIDNGQIMFNSNAKGLLNLGNPFDAATYGIDELPSGWSTDEILREAGLTDEFFKSAAAVNSAWHSLKNEWLFKALMAAWEGGAMIRMTDSQVDEKSTRNTGSGVDEKSFLRQSGGVDITTWAGVKTTQWMVDGSPIVTVIQRSEGTYGRADLPLLSRKPSNVCASVQIEINAPGVYEI